MRLFYACATDDYEIVRDSTQIRLEILYTENMTN